MPNFVVAITDVVFGKIVQTESDDDLVRCSLQEATLNGIPYFFKKFPKIDPTQPKLDNAFRSIHEALCGRIASFINEETGQYFLTPEHHLVVDDNKEILGILCKKINYPNISRIQPDTKFETLFSEPFHIGILTALRFFLADPDGQENISYDGKFSSIDYGLALFILLKDKEQLLGREVTRVANDHSKIFELNQTNILTFFLAAGRGSDPQFLVTHYFPSYITLLGNKSPEFIASFFKEIFTTLKIIANQLSKSDFVGELKITLQCSSLNPSDQENFNIVLAEITDRATKLRSLLSALATLSTEQLKAHLPQDEKNKKFADPIIVAFTSVFTLNKENISDKPSLAKTNFFALETPGAIKRRQTTSGKGLMFVNPNDSSIISTTSRKSLGH